MTTVLSPAPTAPARHPDSATGRAAAPLRGVTLAGLSVIAAASNLLVWTAFPAGVRAQRRIAAVARDRAHRWSGVPIAEPYRPVRSRGIRRVRDLAADPATWRDQFWGLADPFIGAFVALLPIALIAYGTFGAIVQPFVWRSIERAGGNNWYTAIHVHSGLTAAISVPVGIALAAAGFCLGPAILRLHARWTRTLLG
jgi:putative sensor protein